MIYNHSEIGHVRNIPYSFSPIKTFIKQKILFGRVFAELGYPMHSTNLKVPGFNIGSLINISFDVHNCSALLIKVIMVTFYC